MKLELAYEKYADMLYRLALSHLKNPEDAEDAVKSLTNAFSNINKPIELLKTMIEELQKYGGLTDETYTKVLESGDTRLIAILGDEANALKNSNELLKQLEPDDLLKYGLIPEFIGRLPVHVALQALDEKALIEILTKPKNALVKQYKTLFKMEGVELKFTDGAYSAIAQKAMKRKTGARGLRSIMEDLLMDLMYDTPSKKDIKEITIDEDVVNGKAQAKMK